MKTLEQLLKENYERLTDDERKKQVISYIKHTESILDQDIGFIKRLTKVANHILELDLGSLDGLLEKLFQFNGEGIQKIENKIGLEGYTDNRLIAIKSHFYSYKGNVGKKKLELAEKKNKSLDVQIEWAEKWYEDRINSAERAFEIEPMHSAYAYGLAGNLMSCLYNGLTS